MSVNGSTPTTGILVFSINFPFLVISISAVDESRGVAASTYEILSKNLTIVESDFIDVIILISYKNISISIFADVSYNCIKKTLKYYKIYMNY